MVEVMERDLLAMYISFVCFDVPKVMCEWICFYSVVVN